MNGPMNGILNVGPAIDPFFLMYMTGCVSDSDHGHSWEKFSDTDHR